MANPTITPATMKLGDVVVAQYMADTPWSHAVVIAITGDEPNVIISLFRPFVRELDNPWGDHRKGFGKGTPYIGTETYHEFRTSTHPYRLLSRLPVDL